MTRSIKLSSRATHEFWDVPVLHEDESFIALDKPAGLLTSHDRHEPDRPNLVKLLHAGIAEAKPWAVERGWTYLLNAHRLDSEASGVLLLARSKPMLVKLSELFGSEKPIRTYLALVQGVPAEETFEMVAPLAPHPSHPGRMCVAPNRGKRARTRCKVLKRFREFALVECQPLTSRTHQVRVHLKHAGHPLCGDRIYGGKPLLLSRLKSDYRFKEDREERPLIGRAALHALRLELVHPVTGLALSIEAPWPKDLTVAVKYLARFGG